MIRSQSMIGMTPAKPQLPPRERRKALIAAKAAAIKPERGWCSWCDALCTEACSSGHQPERWWLSINSDGSIQRWNDGTPILHHSAEEAQRYGDSGETRIVKLNYPMRVFGDEKEMGNG